MPLKPLPKPQKFLSRLLGFTKAFFAGTVLLPTLLIANFFQVLSLILRPVFPKKSLQINSWIANTWWGFCVFWIHKINRTAVMKSGDDVPADENAVIILNHQTMVDPTILLDFAHSKGRLGDLKCFIKDKLKYVPGIGWGMYLLDFPLVKRSWSADRDTINQLFKRILKHKTPIWMFIFAEGTRIKPFKIKNSQSYAQELGIEAPQHVMIPRTKGFIASIKSLNKHATAVYDLTIGYEKGVPTLWQAIQGHVKRVNLNVKRYAIDEIPKNTDDIGKWVLDRFMKKDKELDYYYKNGNFPTKLDN